MQTVHLRVDSLRVYPGGQVPAEVADGVADDLAVVDSMLRGERVRLDVHLSLWLVVMRIRIPGRSGARQSVSQPAPWLKATTAAAEADRDMHAMGATSYR